LFLAIGLGAFRTCASWADDVVPEPDGSPGWGLLSAPPDSGGEAAPAPPRARLFVDLDYFDPTQLANQLLDATSQSLNESQFSGSNSVSASGAWGGRVGVLVPFNPHIALGGSFGYIAGPKLSENAQGTIGGAASSFSDDLSMNYWRFLAEARERLPLSGSWALGLGEGLGVAVYSHAATCSATNPPSCSTPSTTGTGAGLTWEVEPAIFYGPFGVAVRYAQFPGGLSSGGQFTRQWGSLGSFLEVVF
jgi:hypothetical protein